MDKQVIKREVVDYINSGTGENPAWNYPLDYIVRQLVNFGIESINASDLDGSEPCDGWFSTLLKETEGKAEDFRGGLVSFAAASHYMDEELCDQIGDTEDVSDYIAKYAELHADKYDGDEFAPYYNLAW